MQSSLLKKQTKYEIFENKFHFQEAEVNGRLDEAT